MYAGFLKNNFFETCSNLPAAFKNQLFETKKIGGTNLPPYPHSFHQPLLNFDTVQCTCMYAGFLKNNFFKTCSNLPAAFKNQLFETKKIGGTNLPPYPHSFHQPRLNFDTVHVCLQGSCKITFSKLAQICRLLSKTNCLKLRK